MKTTNIHKYSLGNGQVPMIVLPGGPGFSCRIYQKYLAPLGEYTQLVFWDPRGTGSSAAGEIHFLNDLSDLESIYSEAGVAQIDLLAHSYGGAVALEFATRHPTAVRNLVLVSTCGNFAVLTENLISRIAQKLGNSVTEMAQVLGALQAGRNAELETKFLEFLAQAHFHQAPDNLIKEFVNAAQFNSEVYFKNTDWVRLNFDDRLKNIEAKTVILCGSHDVVIPESFSQSLLKIPNSSLHVIQDVGHWSFIEKPEEFFDLLRTSLSLGKACL